MCKRKRRRPNRYLSSMIIKYFDYYDYRKLYGHHHEVVLPSRNIHFSSGNVYYLQWDVRSQRHTIMFFYFGLYRLFSWYLDSHYIVLLLLTFRIACYLYQWLFTLHVSSRNGYFGNHNSSSHHEVVLPSRNIHFSSGNVYYLQWDVRSQRHTIMFFYFGLYRLFS
jgi:hypothetical protein